MLSDGNTLLVQYHDTCKDCIECRKCVRDCPMDIDIRKSPFQIECVHCGECIDACNTILAKLKKPGLIRYSWGLEGKPHFPFDAKRAVLLAVLVFYAAGLFTALSMRHAVLVRVSADRSTLYRAGADGRIYNHFRYTVANRSRKPSAVVFSMQQLPGATLLLPVNPVAVKPGETVQGEFDIAAAPARHGDFVTHFNILANTIPDPVRETFPMTFISPTEAP